MPQDVSGRIPMPTLDPSTGEKLNVRLRMVGKRGTNISQRVAVLDRPTKPQLKLDENVQSFLPSLKPKAKAKGLIVTSRTPSPSTAVLVPHPPAMHTRSKGMDDASSHAGYNLRLRRVSVRGKPENLPSIFETADEPSGRHPSFKAKKERLKSSRHRGAAAREKKTKQRGQAANKLPDINGHNKGQRPTAPKMDAWAPVSEQYRELTKIDNDLLWYADTAADHNKDRLELPAIKGAETILPQQLVPQTFSEERLPDMPRMTCRQERHNSKRFHARSPGQQIMWARKCFDDKQH
ncbi:uncharacterized protein LOC119733784 [Patiria miniata]|uniref:Uncharacterized protein n=1 Tax=Patiria miniata TaxID=46514 RepID=A0A914AGG9_PATMI|nr:uncharacterized protein LOC119733784 [Patiria miniata]